MRTWSRLFGSGFQTACSNGDQTLLRLLASACPASPLPRVAMPSQRSPACAAQSRERAHSSCAYSAKRLDDADTLSPKSTSGGAPSCKVTWVSLRRLPSVSTPATRLCSAAISAISLALALKLRSYVSVLSSSVRERTPSVCSTRRLWPTQRERPTPARASSRAPSPTLRFHWALRRASE
ncbi:MAG TPA: hypothetical protein VF319_10160 [Caldimonas sp.]